MKLTETDTRYQHEADVAMLQQLVDALEKVTKMTRVDILNSDIFAAAKLVASRIRAYEEARQ